MLETELEREPQAMMAAVASAEFRERHAAYIERRPEWLMGAVMA